MGEYSSDYFFDWLRFANAGMVTRSKIESIELGVKHVPDNTSIVEIGCFCGLSTNIIGFFKEAYGKKCPLFCADQWRFEGAENLNAFIGSSSFITHRQYREFVVDTFKRNVLMFSQYDLPYPIEMSSDEFFFLWESNTSVKDVFQRDVQLGGPLGFCYIDGNHTYAYAHRDFVNSDKHLVTGGFVFFDDSGDDSKWEVKRVISEVKASGKYEVIAHNPNYLFKKLRD